MRPCPSFPAEPIRSLDAMRLAPIELLEERALTVRHPASGVSATGDDPGAEQCGVLVVLADPDRSLRRSYTRRTTPRRAGARRAFGPGTRRGVGPPHGAELGRGPEWKLPPPV